MNISVEVNACVDKGAGDTDQLPGILSTCGTNIPFHLKDAPNTFKYRC